MHSNPLCTPKSEPPAWPAGLQPPSMSGNTQNIQSQSLGTSECSWSSGTARLRPPKPRPLALFYPLGWSKASPQHLPLQLPKIWQRNPLARTSFVSAPPLTCISTAAGSCAASHTTRARLSHPKSTSSATLQPLQAAKSLISPW